MLGNLWKEESSLYRYVEKMDIALCTVIGPPSNGGRPGYEKSSASWRQRHRPTAKFWDRLDRPPERGGGLNLQDCQGHSRRQWAHSCHMEKVVELGEDVGVDLTGT